MHVIVIAFLQIVICRASCGNTLSVSSPCQGVIAWTNNIWIPDGNCQDSIEAEVNATWGYLPFLSPQCRPLVAFKICSDFYPPCQPSNQPLPTCLNVCNAITSPSDLCKDDQAILANLSINAGISLLVPGALPFKGTSLVGKIMNCTGLPSSNCTVYPSGSYSPNITIDRCEPYAGTVCVGIFGGPIFVAQGSSQAYPESILDANAGILNVVEGACAQALPAWACSRAFSSCDAKPYSRATGQNFLYEPPLPSYGCDSYCEAYSVACPNLVLLDPLLDPQCNATVSAITICGTTVFDGIPSWPRSETVYPAFAYGKNLSVTCTSTLGQGGDTSQCPAPLVTPNNPYAPRIFPGSGCSLPCPPIWHFPDAYWKKAETEYVVVSIPSLILTTFMVVTWTLFPIKRSQTYVLCFNVCAFIVSLCLVSSYGVGRDLKDVPCRNPAEFWPQEAGGFCFWQALMIYYFALAGVFWWLVVAFHIYITVVRQMRFSMTNKFALDVCYHIFAWGCPFFLLIIFLGGGGSFGGSQTDPLLFCLFDSNSTQPVEYITFFGPIGVACLVGFFFIGLIMRSLHRSAQAARIRGSAKWKRQIRPFLFVIQFFVIFFFIFFFRIESASKAADIQAAAQSWFKCLISNSSTADGLTKCGSGPAKHLTRPIWIGLFFAIGGQGIVNFLAWGTQRNNFELWAQFCGGKGVGSANMNSDVSTDAVDRSRNSKIPKRAQASRKKEGSKKFAGSESAGLELSTLEKVNEEKIDNSGRSQYQESRNLESESRPVSEINLTEVNESDA